MARERRPAFVCNAGGVYCDCFCEPTQTDQTDSTETTLALEVSVGSVRFVFCEKQKQLPLVPFAGSGSFGTRVEARAQNRRALIVGRIKALERELGERDVLGGDEHCRRSE